MAQSVVYADLKFTAAPACPAAPEEDDSPYENVTLGHPLPAAPSPGRWPRRWCVPQGLLAAALLLLLLVTTVALGACYWQVTRRMQDTSREQEAEQGRLSQELRAREQSLEQARLELAWARAELQRVWREGNGSRSQLGSLSAELGLARQELAVLEKELQELQGKLNSSQGAVSSLRACLNTDCCPPGWVLYRSKCLFISVQKATWWHSNYNCREKQAQLLVQGDWPSWTVPKFVEAPGAVYWVREWNDKPEQLDKMLYTDEPGKCAMTSDGKISKSFCWNLHPWICEKPPELSSLSESLSLLPDKG